MLKANCNVYNYDYIFIPYIRINSYSVSKKEIFIYIVDCTVQ